MSIVRAGFLTALGQFSVGLVGVALALAVPSLLGQLGGLWCKRRLPERTLYRGPLVVLLVAGVNLLLRAVAEFLAA
jgi:uncharacterized membrane protein YfcA